MAYESEVLSLPLVASYERWTVREHQNQKYAYNHGALILLILLASIIGIEEVGVGKEVTTGASVRLPGYNRHSARSLKNIPCQTTEVRFKSLCRPCLG